MAWNVTPSATTKIDRRSEPWVTEAMKAKFRERYLPRYATSLGSLMPICHEVQHCYGWISAQAMEEIAEFLEVTAADVFDFVSFYDEFQTHPTGKHVIGVCQSMTCEACGHQAIVDHLRNRLGIEPHETTKDGQFTLLTMECLGSCDTAPCALVNNRRHDNLTIEGIDQIVDDLSRT
jgi:NADH-quinone oxidoreductase subunit E